MAHSSKLDPQTFDPFNAAEAELVEMLSSPEYAEWCDELDAQLDREEAERAERLLEQADCKVNGEVPW